MRTNGPRQGESGCLAGCVRGSGSCLGTDQAVVDVASIGGDLRPRCFDESNVPSVPSRHRPAAALSGVAAGRVAVAISRVSRYRVSGGWLVVLPTFS